jgi:hypothetical protein
VNGRIAAQFICRRPRLRQKYFPAAIAHEPHAQFDLLSAAGLDYIPANNNNKETRFGLLN